MRSYYTSYNSKPIVESGILTAIAIIFTIISMYSPIIGSFLILFCSVPIILIGARHGIKYSIMSTIVTFLAVTLLIHPLKAVMAVLNCGLVGIVIGHGFRCNHTAMRVLFSGLIASLISKAFLILLFFFVVGINLIDFEEAVIKILREVISFYRNIGMEEEVIRNLSSIVINFFQNALLSTVIIAGIIDSYLNFYLSNVILNKLGHSTKHNALNNSLSIPINTIYIFTLSVAMIYFGITKELYWIKIIGMNLGVISGFFILVQCIAKTYSLVTKYSISGIKLWGSLIFLLLLAIWFLPYVVLYIGTINFSP
ncbi:YybS family protein [Selenomonadales bacterium OttesenSCG-928-I06]|nr:YybS family protein [Selenomonadales bacterium OttesenSCG-928-I06]